MRCSMRNLGLLVVTALALGGLAGPCLAEDTPPPSAPRPEPKLEFLYVELTGVGAPKVEAIANAIRSVEGVRSFVWTFEWSEAKVVREVGKASDEGLLRAAKSAGASTVGFVPIAATNFTFEKKLHCGGCVGAVDKALLAIKGVKESSVSAAMTDVTAVYDTRIVKTSDIEAALGAINKPARVTAR
jgi:copper chaperone CopZ